MFGSFRRLSLHRLFMFCGLILGLAVASQSPAQQCASLTGTEDFDVYNQPARDVQVAGDYAYTADTFGLTVYEVGNPANPQRVGDLLLPVPAERLRISGSVAYVADGAGGLQIIDVSSPGAAVLLGHFDAPGHCYDVEKSGNTIFLATASAGLQLIDATNPAEPFLLGSIDTEGSARGISVQGDIAYLADYYDGLLMIDISDPSSPVLVGNIDTPGHANGVEVVGGAAYVADWESGMEVIDVSDPSQPSIIGNFDTAANVQNLRVAGSLAFLADDYLGLEIVDISDPSNPTLLGSYDSDGITVGIAVSGNIAYLADNILGLDVVNIADPTTPALLGSLITAGDARSITLYHSIAWVPDDWGGLQIIDVSDPSHPSLLAPYDNLGNVTTGVSIFGDIAYLTGGYSGMDIVDVSDPADPTALGHIALPDYGQDVTLSGHIAYVADADHGLQIVEVSDPANPSLIGSIDTQGRAEKVVVSGNIAYVAIGDSGLQTIDVSDPSQPSSLGTIDTPGSARGLAISGSTVYVADYQQGLQIIDVADPAHPALIGNYDSTSYAMSIVFSSPFAYLADYYGGLDIIDVSNPSEPISITQLAGRRTTNDLALDPSTSTIWLADGPIVEGVALGCASCALLELSADPTTIATGGAISTITARAFDAAETPLSGAVIEGATNLGTLSAFTDQGDGRYIATLSSGDQEGSATISISIPETSCTASIEVTIEAAGGNTVKRWIPVAARGSGAQASRWHTALGLLGSPTPTDELTLRFHTQGALVEKSLTVTARQQVLFNDVLAWMDAEGSGALEVLSHESTILSSRTYTELDGADPCFGGGTLGQFLAADDQSPRLASGQVAYLPQLAENAAFRSNIALTNTGDSPAQARIYLYQGNGSEIGSYELNIGPGEWKQDNRPFSARFGINDLDTAWARVEILSGAGLIGYASVVDNLTNDPTTIPLVPDGQGAAANPWVAVASHASGAHGSIWRTDLGILNAGNQAASVQIFFRGPGGGQLTVSVGAGAQKTIADVLGAMGASGSGPVELVSSAPVVLTSRTYALLSSGDHCRPSGTLGQFLPGSTLDHLLSTSEIGYLPQLVENVAFRTNIALSNTGTEEATVRVVLYDGAGYKLGLYLVTLAPGEWKQENRPFATAFGMTNLDSGHAKVKVLSGSAVMVYASVVDNITNDPTTIPVAIIAD